MTTEAEKDFFETFNIKSEMGCTAYEKLSESKADLICTDYCPECKYFEDVYPKITDRHFLELICIIADNMSYFKITGVKDKKLPCSELKEGILYLLINTQNENVGLLTTTEKEDIKHQVQQLFINP